MPDPTLEELLLRKASSIGPQPTNGLGQDLPRPEGTDPVLGAGEFIKGLLGAGAGHSGGNFVGQALGAALPLIPKPLGKMIGNVMRTEEGLILPKGIGPAHTYEDLGKIGGKRVPEAPPIVAPAGFEFAPSNYPNKRSPGILEDLATQRQNDLRTSATNPPNMSPSLSQKTPANKGSRAKVSPGEVKMIRDMFDGGKTIDQIQPQYPQLARPTINDIVRRLSFHWVK